MKVLYHLQDDRYMKIVQRMLFYRALIAILPEKCLHKYLPLASFCISCFCIFRIYFCKNNSFCINTKNIRLFAQNAKKTKIEK